MSKKLLLFAYILAFCGGKATASLVQPGDGPYYQSPEERILYIYDSGARDVVDPLSGYMRAIRDGYDQSFGWKLDEQEDLVLTSPRQQVANAFATVSPDILSVWFPSGAGMMEDMAVSNWALTLATHETSHLYQLNAKGPFNSALKKIFGNTMAITPFVWPIFIHPNFFTPTFLIEGNAVLNESRANLGGRLHSGEVRAEVLAQIKANEIDPVRLINNEFRYPYGANPYQQGGYFEAHLAAKYGVDKTNQFYVAQGDHWLWPFVLNKTFRDHFGASYPQEIREYVRAMQGLAMKQTEGTGDPVADAEFVSPLNHDEHSIFFLATDGLAPSELYVFDKKSRMFTHQPHDLLLGKPFASGDGAWLTAASEQHDLHHIEYSLYGEGDEFNDAYRGQIVSDRRAGKTASLDAKNAWMESRLLLNGAPYGRADSMAALDDNGDVYYFRQDGAVRVLFKNHEPVFKYDGYYGKVTEVGDDGTVYFIANTDYGSTLYEYKDKEIRRVLASDRVVDARRIDDAKFLAVEVTPKGHKVLVETASAQAAPPAVYTYGFPSYNLQPLIAETKPTSREGGYNSLTQMRYSGLGFASSWDSKNGLGVVLDANLVDPLEYNTFELMGQSMELGTQGFMAQYTFTKYLPQFFARYSAEREVWEQQNGARRRVRNQEAALGMQLPLLRWRHWDAQWSVAATYEKNGDHFDPSLTTPDYNPTLLGELYGAKNSFDLSFVESPDPGVAFYPWRQWTLNFQNHLKSQPGTLIKRVNSSMAQTMYRHGFAQEVYASVSVGAAWAETHDIHVDYNESPLTDEMTVPRLTSHQDYFVRNAEFGRFEITKVLHTQAYSARIPIGLDRMAPFLIAQGIAMDADGANYGKYPPSLFEWGYGLDLQVLLFHLVTAKVRLMNAYDTRNPNDKAGNFQALMSAHFNF